MKRFLVALAILVASCGHPKPVTTPSTYAVIERTLDSVVHVTGTFKDDDGASHQYGCTAFAIDTRKFLTAEHCTGADMKVDGHPAFEIAGDKDLDLAVIVADYVKPALKIRTEPLTRQEQVVGLGYGFSWKFPTITRHYVMIEKYTPGKDIAPGVWLSGGFIGGMSGGPVIDFQGLVVAVVQRGNSQVGYGVTADTINKFLATPVVIVDEPAQDDKE